jgi:hypothetical protein
MKILTRAQRVLSICHRNQQNIVAHGWQSPRFQELLYANTKSISQRISAKAKHEFANGMFSAFISSEPFEKFPPSSIESAEKQQYCRKHWIEGMTWDEAGAYAAYERMIKTRGGAVDGCKNYADVVRRFKYLDRLFDVISKDRRLKTQFELGRSPCRWMEPDGIVVHVNHYGMPVFGGGGSHRLAIGRILEIDTIPCTIGFVHPGSLPNWKKNFLEGGNPAQSCYENI